MTSPTRSEQPHLVSLVLQSKKALQHGEQLCSRASGLSRESTQNAVDVLALDAKVKWFTGTVLEQLKLAASVAKSIEQKRAQLEQRAQEWDVTRVQRTDALDAVLESLGAQLVPPDFHQTSSASSIFGSQHSDDEGDNERPAQLTPTNGAAEASVDRSRWKTLRDFVDERAIEDALETMDNDRTRLDKILTITAGHPESLTEHISTIQGSLPSSSPIVSIDNILHLQETASIHLANHLESLVAHYGQMASALHDKEAGEVFSEDDLQEMNRDTEELPAIIVELEENVASVEKTHALLVDAKSAALQHLDTHRTVLDDLVELGDIMDEMLERQQEVEMSFSDQLSTLNQHLSTVEDLHVRFTSYQTAYNKLMVEMARRNQYREAAENIVRGMMTQLEAMAEEERHTRDNFYAVYGLHLPDDICLSIQNPPTKWEVVPAHGGAVEVLPNIDNDLLIDARDRIVAGEGDGVLGSGSL